jgi:hypothetical protein
VTHPPGPAANQALHVTITQIRRVSLPANVPVPAGGVPVALTVTVANPTHETLYLDTLDIGAGAATPAGQPAGIVYCSADYVANATWRPPGSSLFPLPAGSQPVLPLQYPMNGYLLTLPAGSQRTGTLTVFAARHAANALWIMDNCSAVATPLVRVSFTLP